MLTTLVVAVVVLVALLLITPVDFDLCLERRPVFRYRFGVRWLYGLIRKELGPPEEWQARPVEAKEEPAKKKRRRKRARGPHHVVAMLRSKGFLQAVGRLFQRLIRAIGFRDLALWLRAGFEDPAHTGVLCGFLLPVATYFQAQHPGSVDVAPDFSQETLEFAFAGQVRITPVHLVWPVLIFGLSPSTLRGLIALRTGRVG
jgi:hypothetical protein